MTCLLRESGVIVLLGGGEVVIVPGQVDDAEAAGVAMCCAAGEALADRLNKADAALYAAKRDGKHPFREAADAGV